MAQSTHPDNALCERAKRGDRAAFAQLYERYASELYRKILMPRCGRPDLAEEALAETFRTLLSALARYEPHALGPWPWLARVAASKVIDVHRAQQRKTRALTNFTRLISPLVPDSAPADDATRAREQSDLARAVQEVLAALNPRYRQAIELRFFQERAREECAEAMHITLGNFDVTLLRALRAFKAEWETRHTRESTP
jgi:RNA polymerase sigma factor (sigma-70 family)